MKADTGLTALVAAASINPVATPTRPFIVLRSPVTQPIRAACVRGGTIAWDIHAFARARESGGAVVETAEDHAGSIGAEIERVLADNNLTLESGAKCRVRLSDIRLLEDESPTAYHWFAQVNCRVLAA